MVQQNCSCLASHRATERLDANERQCCVTAPYGMRNLIVSPFEFATPNVRWTRNVHSTTAVQVIRDPKQSSSA